MQPLFLMRWSLQVANTLGSQLLDMRKNGAMESQKIMQGYSHYKKRLLGGHSSTNGTEETRLSCTSSAECPSPHASHCTTNPRLSLPPVSALLGVPWNSVLYCFIELKHLGISQDVPSSGNHLSHIQVAS